jgi:hydroxymethylbilane synthase
MLRRMVASFFEAVDALVFPWRCPICDEGAVGTPFCVSCRRELLEAAGSACPRCAMPVGPWARRDGGCSECRGERLGFDAAIALGPYQGPIRQLCLMLKHDRHAWLARWLIDLLVEARAEVEQVPADAWVVPVPLHWKKQWKRGFNQADELARRLAGRLELRRVPALRRVVKTDSLARLSRADRKRLLRDAFRVRPGLDRALAGRTVVLVDDILTTGATTGAAARTLKKAGAGRVLVVVIGRTGGDSKMSVIDLNTSTTAPTGPRLVNSIRIGTRGSPLARWQAEWVAGRLRALHPGLAVELVEIKTQGDRDRNSPLAAIGGQGLFTKEIQRALLDEVVEVAVHSLKDLPTRGPEGLILGAVPPREAMADALIAPIHRTLDALPAGATVGTGSLRRRAQLLFLRPDLRVVGIRGNVESRLNQALGGTLDAVVLAEAGLRRLGLEAHVTECLGPPRFLPAVGQGALGIECRADDAATRALLAPLDDPATRAAVVAERRTLAELEGGCMIPMAAWGRTTDEGLTLAAAVFDSEGRERVFTSLNGSADDPDDLGLRVARALRDQGADRLLEGVRRP